MSDTVLVTGATGRIGPTVVDSLRERFHVVGCSRRGGDVGDAHVRADLTEPGETYGVVAKVAPDAVVHLGMLSRPDHTPGYVTFESQVMTTYHVLEACEAVGVDTAVVASSMSALGAGFDPDPVRLQYLPLDESHPVTPRDPYGLGKHVMEVTADGVGRRDSAPRTLTSLRVPLVVDDDSVRDLFVEDDRSLEAIRDADFYHSVRNTLFSYLHVDDYARLVEAALDATHTGHEVVWAAAADTTVDHPTSELVSEEYPDAEVRAEFEGYESLVSTEKTNRLLGWEPRRSWRERG